MVRVNAASLLHESLCWPYPQPLNRVYYELPTLDKWSQLELQGCKTAQVNNSSSGFCSFMYTINFTLSCCRDEQTQLHFILLQRHRLGTHSLRANKVLVLYLLTEA